MEAWVTLATNDGYAVGALTLAASLRRVGTTRRLVIMVTKEGISKGIKDAIYKKFDEVVEVDSMDSNDAENLKLLARPDLGITFTKLHCWTLTQYTKCVFLDADTLVLVNVDELFDREELSAAPDAGWPDCFNSGVFVFRPSKETFQALLAHANSEGSFDGGDQGLLNTFFSGWATEDIKKHLPFTYNMVASATYSYLPAYAKFGKNVKIVHFIGASKPWTVVDFTYSGEPKSGPKEAHALEHLKLWWQIYITEVRPEIRDITGSQPFLTAVVPAAFSTAPPPVSEAGGAAAAAPVQSSASGSPKDTRESWERGTPDYKGTASFENILKKIDASMSKE